MPHQVNTSNKNHTSLNDEKIDPTETELVSDYKKLNEKCDMVITKIKKRKLKAAAKN